MFVWDRLYQVLEERIVKYVMKNCVVLVALVESKVVTMSDLFVSVMYVCIKKYTSYS